MSDSALRREAMVRQQIAARGVHDPRVLEAMREVPREVFLPEDLAGFAYDDTPLPIAEGQTISQPYIVALMIAAIRPGPRDRVLEIGTGSGYGAAALSRVVGQVYTIERHGALAAVARQRLESLGYRNVEVVEGDGTLGLPAFAPFDAIIVTAGGPDVPAPLLDQLAPGGRLVGPFGPRGAQTLVRIRRAQDGRLVREELGACRFVDLIGEHGFRA
jgi:protein-L-isoaspartate(D-aspartate) O-methyltransferase